MSTATHIALQQICTGIAAPMLLADPGGPPRTVMTAIRKTRVSADEVFVGRLGIEGDEQADPSVHGGLDKAVYAYPTEHWKGWAEVLTMGDVSWEAGRLGENLCITGAQEDEVFVGDLWHQGDTVLRVTSPRIPCFKLATALGLPTAGKRMYQLNCCGWYLAVVSPGILKRGEEFEIETGPRDISIAQALQNTRRRSDR